MHRRVSWQMGVVAALLLSIGCGEDFRTAGGASGTAGMTNGGSAGSPEVGGRNSLGGYSGEAGEAEQNAAAQGSGEGGEPGAAGAGGGFSPSGGSGGTPDGTGEAASGGATGAGHCGTSGSSGATSVGSAGVGSGRGGGSSCTDSDGDGTCDNIDACPDDPDKNMVGACGCGVADTDADANGDADCLDWRCTVGAYGGGDGCDCGCGAADPDCDGGAIDACATCEQPGSCAVGACPANVDASDLGSCDVAPTPWRCDAAYYSNGQCECGCGSVDPDCGAGTLDEVCHYCTSVQILRGSCGVGTECPANIDPANIGSCVVPEAWTCGDSAYGSGDGCHCGCGALDPDCFGTTAGDCDVCDAEGSCATAACASSTITGSDNSHCGAVPPPDEWRCDAVAYGSGNGCDCGCGAADPDCADASVAACDSCDLPGSCGVDACASALRNIDEMDNSTCSLPEGLWTCSYGYYGDAVCDCGCGALDPDCPSSMSDACVWCANAGSCGVAACGDPEDNISATDNSSCTPPSGG